MAMGPMRLAADRARRPLPALATRVCALAGAILTVFGFCLPAWGQREPVHYFHSGDLPPAAVGQGQLLRGGPLRDYFQPVEILAPAGAAVSVCAGGRFEPAEKAPVLVGLLIGQVYWLKITGIPQSEGFEVFPTVEVINRLYPPPGLERHFPIPIQLTEEELKWALTGTFVTRVIYLEDPQQALPARDTPDVQRYYDVRSDEDPLKAADRLGRPMAILRMGSRTPEFDLATGQLAATSPPLIKLTRPAPIPALNSGLEPAFQAPPAGPGQNPPRLPLPPRPYLGTPWLPMGWNP